MHNIKKILLFIFVLSFFFIGVTRTFAQEDSYWTNFATRLGEDIKEIRAYNDLTNKQDVTAEELISQADSLSERLTESLTYYNQPVPTDGDQEYLFAIETVKEGITKYNQGLQDFSLGIQDENRDEVSAATQKLNEGNTQITQGISQLEDRLSQDEQSGQQTQNMYLWGTIICGIVSLVFLFKSRKKSKYPTEQARIKLFGQLFLTSLWPTGGFLFTFLSYSSTTSGHYTVAYGAIGIGLFSLLRQLFEYITKVKPELDVYISAEKILIDHYADLYRLYTSIPADEFKYTVVGKYHVSDKVARFIHQRIFEFETSAKHEERVEGYDPYETLGVNKDDSLETIKNKYRELAKKYHPDISKSNTEEEFKKINNAYTSILREHGVR